MKFVEGPKGRVYLDHNPKTVALIGMGPSFQDYLQETMTQELTPEHHDEVWGINMIGNALRCDVVFWMDDLKAQAELNQHINIPTAALKQVLQSPHGLVLEQSGGDPIRKYIAEIMGLPEIVRQATYEEFAAGFDNRAPLFGNVPLATILAIKNAMNEDRKNNHRDMNSNLAGLIKMLDRHKTPVVTPKRRPDYVENSFDYPIEEVAGIGLPIFGKPYLNNGVAMAIGYAIWKGVTHLKIYGCDFTYPNREYAEEGRACVEAWITLAIKSGMQIALPPHTSLIDMVKGSVIYGYAEPPEIEYEGKVYKFGTETVMQTAPQFRAPDTRAVANEEQITNVLSQSNQADSATGPARSKRRFRAPASPAGSVRAPDAHSA